MILGFKCGETEAIWQDRMSRRLPSKIQAIARHKLHILNNAAALADPRIPPANRLEALKGEYKRRHSIRINDQRRIYFVWNASGAAVVEIFDYH
jgi:toxin HigB-1